MASNTIGIAIHLDYDLAKYLTNKARHLRVTRAQLIRSLILSGLSQHELLQQPTRGFDHHKLPTCES